MFSLFILAASECLGVIVFVIMGVVIYDNVHYIYIVIMITYNIFLYITRLVTLMIFNNIAKLLTNKIKIFVNSNCYKSLGIYLIIFSRTKSIKNIKNSSCA